MLPSTVCRSVACFPFLCNLDINPVHTGVNIIFVTGRDSVCADETARWLMDRIPFQEWDLHMRKEGDKRKDSIVKEEIYRAHIKGKYNVLFVLDDRDQAVRKWRDLGLRCLQVSDGDF